VCEFGLSDNEVAYNKKYESLEKKQCKLEKKFDL